jgi:molybdenum cofactor synthesis domain-containing protein
MSQVEIISIGNELLIGKVTNTNASWLADKITRLGGRVRRIVVVADDLGEIASSIREAIARDTCLIITTGGLGPTYDDMTLSGIARCFGLEMEVNEEALDLIKAKYGSKGWELTPARRKMAIFPRGARPIPNPVGTAPAMKLEVKDSVVYALPGVPPEMEAIFEKYIATEIKEKLGNLKFGEARLLLRGIPESSLAPLLDEVRKNNTDVYIKSHPKGTEAGQSVIEVHITCYSSTEDNASKLASKAASDLAILAEKKFNIRPLNA